ncbi:MAG: efflux RND transporter periplasmic adaptor subunit [bacterium]|nr:efflux RND transporter periplasmic adaptor subunit [bacterium]
MPRQGGKGRRPPSPNPHPPAPSPRQTLPPPGSGGAGVPVLVLLFALALLAGCNQGNGNQEVEFRVPVSVREVETGTVEDLIIATGTLRTPQSALLRVETAGLLTIARSPNGRRLAEGDRVSAGQTLAEVAGEDVRLAAGSAAARQRYQEAEADIEAKRSLFANGVISEDFVRRAESAAADAKLAWERSQLTEERSRLVTPIAGVILWLARDGNDLPMADGQRVELGSPVAQVAPITALIADVDLVGADIARVEPGLEARLRHFAWEGKNFTGRVMRLAPTIDPVTRTVRVEVEVDNTEKKLRPGMFVEVTLVAERRDDVPVVPREAVTERGGSRVVFVLDSQRVEQREVVPGLGDDEIVEVRQGLEPGERVVVRGLETLTDGTRVRVSGG